MALDRTVRLAGAGQMQGDVTRWRQERAAIADWLLSEGCPDEAEEVLESLLGLSNDVGLFSEMVDPSSGDQLGNTPQAFTHMAVVTSCSAISAARRGRLPGPDARVAYVETDLDRRLSQARLDERG